MLKDIEKAESSGKDFKAVLFAINSPGGSPVCSSLMADRVLGFAKIRNLPFYTFAEDLAASGGYWLLCVGDKTFAHPSSVVGSIGVISMAWAGKGALDKNQIGRYRVDTSDQLI